MSENEGTKEPSFDASAIVGRVQDGDPGAEQALVCQYSRGLILMLTHRCNDPELAADLHQETFIVVLKRLREAGIEDPSKIKSFIWATANNLFINEYRKLKRRNTWADTDRFDYIADETSDLVASLETEQTAARVRQMIQSLPVARDREMLYRFYISGEEKPSICASLELDAHHFDRVIHRAKQRLKQIYLLGNSV